MQKAKTVTPSCFNSVQLALVLEDYEPPALRVQGFVSRKKGARSMVEEKKEGEKIIIIIIIIIMIIK